MRNGIKDLPQSLISAVKETMKTNQDLHKEDLKRRYPFAFEKEETQNLSEETMVFEGDKIGNYEVTADRMGNYEIKNRTTRKSVYLQGDDARTFEGDAWENDKFWKLPVSKQAWMLSQYDDVMEGKEEKTENLDEKFKMESDTDKVDMSKALFKSTGKSNKVFVVMPRDTKGMAGSQDKFKMYLTAKDGKVHEYLGSHASIEGAKKFGMNNGYMSEETITEGIPVEKLKVGKVYKFKDEIGQTFKGKVTKIRNTSGDEYEVDYDYVGGSYSSSKSGTFSDVKKGDKSIFTKEERLIERKIRKAKNGMWKVESWANEEDFNAKKAPQTDFVYTQGGYNKLIDEFKKQGRFWEENEIDGNDLYEQALLEADIRKAASEISKIDSKVGSIVAKGNFPSAKDMKKLDGDDRDDIYMIMAKYVDPDVIADKYGVDMNEADNLSDYHSSRMNVKLGPDGRGKFKVNYVSPDGKSIGNDRFETRMAANRYANDLKRKGYKNVYIGESKSEYTIIDVSEETMENETWADVLEASYTPGVNPQSKSKKSYASGYDNELKLILRGPGRDSAGEARKDAAKMKKAGYENVTTHVDAVMEDAIEEARVLGRGMSKDALARDTEQSDREYLEQRKFKDNWKKKNPGKKWPGYKEAGFNEEKKLDPVGKEDDDVDNDGDSDESDDYLKKRRKAIAKRMKKNVNEENGYIAFYNGKKYEIYADTLWAAKKKAIAQLKVPKSKQGLLAIKLAEKDGKQVTHSTADL